MKSVRRGAQLSELKETELGNFLAVQWLGLRVFTAKAAGSIPNWGTKILQAAQHGQK